MNNTPQKQFATEVVERLREAGFEALWAGGCVRDALLEREPGDYDVATGALPEDVRKVFGKRRTLAVGASFGVIIVLGGKECGQVEVATFRSDGEYLDGRRPQSVTFCSAEHDAQRRDFTINGMFFDPIAGEIIDYVGGKEDIEKCVLRAIGDPHQRFEEDKLRLLRAVRFAARLGFDLEENTRAAVEEFAPKIRVVSAERIAAELHKMLTIPNRCLSVELAHDTGLLAEILPEVGDPESVLPTVRRLKDEASFELVMASLLQSQDAKPVEQICLRLKLSNKETDAIVWLVSNQNAVQEAATFSLAKLKRLLVHPLIAELFELVAARAGLSDPADVDFCRDYLRKTPTEVLNPTPLLTGDTLIRAGFAPGPQFKTVLDQVRDSQLNNEITTLEEAMSLAAQIYSPNL